MGLGFSVWLLAYVAGNLGYRVLTHVLLIRYVLSSRRPLKSLRNYPGISVLVPIKGPVEDLELTLGSILRQSYPGKLELVIAIRDLSDPAIQASKELVSSLQSSVQVKWAVGGEPSGLNPKNSNLAQAFALATHDWIYCSDVDTRLGVDHLREMIEISEDDATNYVTSITIHDGPKDLGACLEVLGTNLEATGFFLFAFLNPRCGVLNGASNLVHRSLLKKVGGFERSVNALTEDLLMGKLFVKAGAKGKLAKNFVRVTQEHQSLRGFSERHIRWMMIAKYFRPDLFWPAPLNWAGQWVVFYGLVVNSPAHFFLGLSLLLLRVFDVLIYEILTGVPKEDRTKVWAIVIYDFLAPPLWIRAIFRSQVVWGGNILHVLSNGMLERAHEDVGK